MAPLGDRNANRQSRIPTKSVGLDSPYGNRTNNENAPPSSNLSRLLAPTKSSVARSKTPSPIPLPIVPRATAYGDSSTRGRLHKAVSNDNLSTSDTSARGRLHKALSHDTLSTSTSRHLPEKQTPSSPILVALKEAQRSASPSPPARNPVRQNRSDSPMEVLKGTQSRAPGVSTLPAQQPQPTHKPLPSRPTTTFVSLNSPTRDSDSIIDATEQPLIRSPGTSQEEEWPTLTPERVSLRSSATTSVKRQSSTKIPRTSVQTVSSAKSVVSPIISQKSVKPSSPQLHSTVSSPVATKETQNTKAGLLVDDSTENHPTRSSSLQHLNDAEVGLGIMTEASSSDPAENLEHKHMPAPSSFSQPRIRHPSRSPCCEVRLPFPIPEESVSVSGEKTTEPDTPVVQSKPMPILITKNSPPSNSPSADDILTFAGRRLGNINDLAVLDQGKGSVEKTVQRKAQLSLDDLPPRTAPGLDANKLSPMRYIFGDKGLGSEQEDGAEYSRVKQLSRGLGSSSFAGSTLSISDDADQLILGPSSGQASKEASPVRAEFELPSPSSNGFHVSWPADFGFTALDQLGSISPTVQSSPSIRNESMGFSRSALCTSIQEESEHTEGTFSQAENTLMRLTQNLSSNGKDRSSTATTNPEEHINTTLSILEGTPVKQSIEIEYLKEVDRALKSRKIKDAVRDNNGQTSIMDRPAPLSIKLQLPKAVPQDRAESPAPVKNDRLPSYMLPTPASEARRQPTVQSTTTKGSTLTSDSRPGSRAARSTPTPTPEVRRTSRTSTPDNRNNPVSGRLTPSSEIPRPATSGRATPSTDTRNDTTTNRPSANRKSSRSILAKSSMPALKEPAATTPFLNKRTSLPSLKTRHVPLTQVASNVPRPASPIKSSLKTPKHTRNESRGKTVLDNLKGIFSSKRDVPPVPGSSGRRFSISSRNSMSSRKSISVEQPDVPELPPMPRQRSKSIARSIMSRKDADDEIPSDKGKAKAEGSATAQRSRRKSLAKSISSRKDVDPDGDERPGTSGKSSKDEKRQTVALMEMGLTMREEAYKEDDLVRKERMASFAQVMLDTVTNAVEAERNMYAAMQAAEQAKLSYMMTQESVHEMSRLVSTSRRIPLFKKKKKP